MSAYVIWLDHEHAKLFKMVPGQVDPKVMWRKDVTHHTTTDANNHKEAEKFFHSVTGVLNDAHEILVVGPGLAKDHFKHHLETHHHADLAKRVVGLIAMDHPTDGQILAEARKYFKKNALFAS